jgi:hypothetical protein
MNGFAKVVNVDSVMAEALFISSAKNGPAGAERELMLAVLTDAIECYWKYQRSAKRSAVRLYQDAKNWIFAEKDSLPFSFTDVCEMLQLDPGYIRRGVLIAGRAAPGSESLDADCEQQSDRRNIKRKLKSGRSWKGSSRLSRSRVRPLRVGPRS